MDQVRSHADTQIIVINGMAHSEQYEENKGVLEPYRWGCEGNEMLRNTELNLP